MGTDINNSGQTNIFNSMNVNQQENTVVKKSDENNKSGTSVNNSDKALNDKLKQYDTNNDGKISPEEMYQASCIFSNPLNNSNPIDNFTPLLNEITNISKISNLEDPSSDIAKINEIIEKINNRINQMDLSPENIENLLLNIQHALSACRDNIITRLYKNKMNCHTEDGQFVYDLKILAYEDKLSGFGISSKSDIDLDSNSIMEIESLALRYNKLNIMDRYDSDRLQNYKDDLWNFICEIKNNKSYSSIVNTDAGINSLINEYGNLSKKLKEAHYKDISEVYNIDDNTESYITFDIKPSAALEEQFNKFASASTLNDKKDIYLNIKNIIEGVLNNLAAKYAVDKDDNLLNEIKQYSYIIELYNISDDLLDEQISDIFNEIIKFNSDMTESNFYSVQLLQLQYERENADFAKNASKLMDEYSNGLISETEAENRNSIFENIKYVRSRNVLDKDYDYMYLVKIYNIIKLAHSNNVIDDNRYKEEIKLIAPELAKYGYTISL